MKDSLWSIEALATSLNSLESMLNALCLPGVRRSVSAEQVGRRMQTGWVGLVYLTRLVRIPNSLMGAQRSYGLGTWILLAGYMF